LALFWIWVVSKIVFEDINRELIQIGGPNHDRIGFRYWKNPGPFTQFADIPGNKGRFLAWWAVMTQAAFSFIGTEIVAVCRMLYLLCLSGISLTSASDCCWRDKESQAKHSPCNKAGSYSYVQIFVQISRRSSYSKGILLFYVCGVIVIGWLVPSNSEGLDLADGTAASSPFVIAIENAGIKVLPHVSHRPQRIV